MSQRFFGRNPWIVAILTFPNAEVHINRSVKRVNVMPSCDVPAFIRNYPVCR